MLPMGRNFLRMALLMVVLLSFINSAIGGTISGTVANSSGVGLQNALVRAYNAADENSMVKSTHALSNGNYSLTNMAAGNYKIKIDPPISSNYLPEWYNDRSNFTTADVISLSTDQTINDINTQLSSGGVINGKVSNQSDIGIQGISVSVYDSANQNSFIKLTSTDTNGNYSLIGLSSGNYKIEFGPPYGSIYMREWFDNKTSLATADIISLSSGQTINNLNAQLATGGTLSGKVTGPTGIGIQGVEVEVYRGDCYTRIVQTDANGNFSVVGLEGGHYRILFTSSQNYVAEWYNNKFDQDAADFIWLPSGGTISNINAQLAEGGIVTGRITGPGPSFTGIQGVSVRLENIIARCRTYSSSTDSNGNFTIQGIPAGNYKTSIGAPYNQNYLSEWYNDKSDFNSADTVTIVTGETLSNINAQLALGGMITGRVTDQSGNEIPGITAKAYSSQYSTGGSATTDSDGYYTIQKLTTGNYKVNFSATGSNYISKWYDSKDSYALADNVPVVVGATTSNINAQLVEGEQGGIISGTIRDSQSNGISQIYVTANQNSTQSVSSVYSQNDGTYQITGLPTGTYKVKFYVGNIRNFLSEWYNDKLDYNTADIVSVIAGSNTSGVDAVLDVGGIITGRVTDYQGIGLYFASVDLYDFNQTRVRTDYTDCDGYYMLMGISTGNYKIYFRNTWSISCQSFVRSEWYDNELSFATADFIAVTAGQTLTGINAQLGSILFNKLFLPSIMK